jgi:hypothetical protein
LRCTIIISADARYASKCSCDHLIIWLMGEWCRTMLFGGILYQWCFHKYFQRLFLFPFNVILVISHCQFCGVLYSAVCSICEWTISIAPWSLSTSIDWWCMILLAAKSCNTLQLVIAMPWQCAHRRIGPIQFVPGLGKRIRVERELVPVVRARWGVVLGIVTANCPYCCRSSWSWYLGCGDGRVSAGLHFLLSTPLSGIAWAREFMCCVFPKVVGCIQSIDHLLCCQTFVGGGWWEGGCLCTWRFGFFLPMESCLKCLIYVVIPGFSAPSGCVWMVDEVLPHGWGVLCISNVFINSLGYFLSSPEIVQPGFQWPTWEINLFVLEPFGKCCQPVHQRAHGFGHRCLVHPKCWCGLGVP